jgi:D-galacturonate reductase
MQTLGYNDLANDRQTVAAVQALEAILTAHVNGEPDCVVRVNDKNGGLVLYRPGCDKPDVLYSGTV